MHRIDFSWIGSWLSFLATWLFTRPGRHLLAWIAVFFLGSYLVGQSWRVNGHITCDFAGQWLMGRMFFLNKGDELYLNPPQRKVLEDGYRMGDEALKKLVAEIKEEAVRTSIEEKCKADSVKMIQDILDKNSSEYKVEGALYPPVASLLFWPFAGMPPQPAHAVIVFLHFLMALLNGWCISRITEKRVQWGEAVFIILACPNSLQAFLLCQNSMFSLTFLCVGWYFLHRKWPFLGGLVWGCFAFKPVFAISLLLVPVLLPNRRMLVGMILGGAGLCLATLPFVGTVGLAPHPPVEGVLEEPKQPFAVGLLEKPPIQITSEAEAARMNPWERWLIVGKNAARIYSYDTNWVWMSRDLVGLPRRRMWDPESMAHTWDYVYRRYFRGLDTWHNPWNAWLEEKQREQDRRWQQYSEDWPEDRKQAWRDEDARWHEEYNKKLYERWDAWNEGKKKAWDAHQQKTYNPNIGGTEEEVEIAQANAQQASMAASGLLFGFLLMTVLIGFTSRFVPWLRGIPAPPQAQGSRAAFLLFGGIFGCWHFMHYDLILCALPLCLMLADVTKRSWPVFPGPVIALTLLTVIQAVLTFLTFPEIKDVSGLHISEVWWMRCVFGVQLLFGLLGLFMLILRRRRSWLLLVGVVLLLLLLEIAAGVCIFIDAEWQGEVVSLLQGVVTVLPLLVMLLFLGGRCWLLLLVTLFLLCNWDLSYGYGIIRFPFETILGLVFWNWSGCLALKEMEDRSSPPGISTTDSGLPVPQAPSS